MQKVEAVVWCSWIGEVGNGSSREMTSETQAEAGSPDGEIPLLAQKTPVKQPLATPIPQPKTSIVGPSRFPINQGGWTQPGGLTPRLTECDVKYRWLLGFRPSANAAAAQPMLATASPVDGRQPTVIEASLRAGKPALSVCQRTVNTPVLQGQIRLSKSPG
jgi:hypothetical protein